MIYNKVLYASALLVMVLEMILVMPKTLGRREMLVAYPKHLAHKDDQSADQAIKGMHLIETKAGLRMWEINSDSASEFKGKGQLVLDKIRTRFFGDGGIQFFVKGSKGKMDLETNNILIEGDVVTKTSNNYEMKSNNVTYFSQSRELKSSDPVFILGPKDRKGNRLKLQGIGMNANITNGKVDINKDVNGETSLDNGSKIKIKSESVGLSSVSKQAHFKGNVEIDVDTMRVTGPSAQFQYSEDGDSLSSVFIDGGIKVTDVDKFATSQNVNVDFREDKFTFKGQPRLVKDNDEVFGDEIVFLNGGKRVRVKGVKAELESQRTEGVK